jgi:hypothetical protein
MLIYFSGFFYGCFGVSIAELITCDRVHMTLKTESVYYLVFYRKKVGWPLL